jgi:hypothetical protein
VFIPATANNVLTLLSIFQKYELKKGRGGEYQNSSRISNLIKTLLNKTQTCMYGGKQHMTLFMKKMCFRVKCIPLTTFMVN